MLVKIFYVVSAIVCAVLIIALFVKKDYAVERSFVIDRPIAEVFDHIRYLKNHDHFNKWSMADPGMSKSYKGTDGTVGFVYQWESNDSKVSKGEQEIKMIIAGERIDYELRFIKPFEGFASSYLITEVVDPNRTRVKWGFTSAMPYPMNLVRLFFDIEGMFKKDIDGNLIRLKSILEKR